MEADWTKLPADLLETISRNLKVYADYVRLRSVCQSWRTSVPKIPKHLPPQLPWLMLPESQSRPYRSFLKLPTNRVHSLYLPEASHGKRHCGSSHGWLIVVDETPSVLLLNPLTRSKLYLPPLSSFPHVLRFNYSDIGREYKLRPSFGRLNTRSLRQMRDYFLRKVVLSSSPLEGAGDFTALAILGHSFETEDLAFCKNGDQSWTFIDDTYSYSEDVIYMDGLFCAVNKRGGLAVCDVRGGSPAVSIVEPTAQVRADLLYMVNSGDDLLLVTRCLDLDNSMDDGANVVYRTVGFDVFRMDWNGPSWEKVSNLGDRTLFIGLNSSLSLSASDFPGCVGNCIYFTDDYSEFETSIGDHDSGIFRVWDRTIQKQWNTQYRVPWPQLLWVTPNFS